MPYTLNELNRMLDNGLTVFEHYYQNETGLSSGNFRQKLKSPFLRNGETEKDPSFSVFFNTKKGLWFFKDHGLDKIGSHWQFVMDLYGIDFKDACDKVKAELLGINKQGHVSVPISRANFQYVKSEPRSGKIEITPCIQDFTESNLAFWKSFGVSKSTLDIFKGSDLHHYDMKKESKTFRITQKPDSPMFGFEINGRFKIYQPLDPKYKWTSNLIAEEDVFGFDLLPKECEHLFLMGGNKDSMSFYENMGYPVAALASESTNLTEGLLSVLRRIAKNIWVFYDPDTQGYKKANQFKEQYGLNSLNHLLEPFNAGDFGEFIHDNPTKVNEFHNFLLDNINKTYN